MDKKINYKLMYNDGNVSFEIAGFPDKDSAEKKCEIEMKLNKRYSDIGIKKNEKTDYLISYKKVFKENEIKDIFISNGWESGNHTKMLVKAFSRASHVVSVSDSNGLLIGIARSMDDGSWSANIDCVIVHKDFQKKGIGTIMMKALLQELGKIKYISVSPDNPETAAFYQKFGFYKTHGINLQKKN